METVKVDETTALRNRLDATLTQLENEKAATRAREEEADQLRASNDLYKRQIQEMRDQSRFASKIPANTPEFREEYQKRRDLGLPEDQAIEVAHRQCQINESRRQTIAAEIARKAAEADAKAVEAARIDPKTKK